MSTSVFPPNTRNKFNWKPLLNRCFVRIHSNDLAGTQKKREKQASYKVEIVKKRSARTATVISTLHLQSEVAHSSHRRSTKWGAFGLGWFGGGGGIKYKPCVLINLMEDQ